MDNGNTGISRESGDGMATSTRERKLIIAKRMDHIRMEYFRHSVQIMLSIEEQHLDKIEEALDTIEDWCLLSDCPD